MTPKERSEQRRRSWERPDEMFFAAGACHILAHVFMEAYPDAGFEPFVIHPADGGVYGYHVFVARGTTAFDAQGYRPRQRILDEVVQRQRRRDPLWLPLVSRLDVPVVTEGFCTRYRHLSFAEYHADPAPRARAYLSRFPHPDQQLQRARDRSMYPSG